MAPVFRNEALSDSHDRASFSCGDPDLDQYFKTQVGQDIRRRMTKCRVTVDASNERVAAFYTLSAASVNLQDLPKAVAKGLPRYPLPTFLMGRLAVDLNYRGLRLGESLLGEAVSICMAAEIGGFGLIVDAKTSAEAFYLKYGFIHYTSLPGKLILVFPRVR